MTTRGAVTASGVSKRYRRRGAGIRHRHDDVWALRDIDIDVEPGEMLGLVGVNGSGKSTLLRIAAGVVAPSEGSVVASGRVAGILSLGDGFHTLLTGRENALTAAILSGMRRKDALERLPAMLAFSELGDAVEDPVRTYSAGMFVRLAYAVAAHVDADILLVDEALAVGDLAFASKCLDHLENLRSAGTTILLASHDLDMVRRTCDRVAWIHRGELRSIGDPDPTIDEYQRASHTATIELTPDDRAAAGRLGSGDVVVESVAVLAGDGRPTEVIPTGGTLVVQVSLRSVSGIDTTVVSISLHERKGDAVVDVSRETTLDADGSTRDIEVSFDRLDLRAGSYTVAVGAHAPEFEHAYDYVWEAAHIVVTGPNSQTPLSPPHTWRAR